MCSGKEVHTNREPLGPLIVLKFATGPRLIQHVHDGRGL